MYLMRHFDGLITPQYIRRQILDLIISLKRKRLWRFLDRPTRGWLNLAIRLRSIKFRSKEVLFVLMKILNRLKPLLRITNLLKSVGMTSAWRNSILAESWGNPSARIWRSSPSYQLYCGLVEIQLSRITPGLSSSGILQALPLQVAPSRILRLVEG